MSNILGSVHRWPLSAVAVDLFKRDFQDMDKRLEELQMQLLKLATVNADYEKVGDEIY